MSARTSPTALNDRVIHNVRRLRKIRGWSAEELAARLTEAGCPIGWNVIATRESRAGRESRHDASRISVDELFAFAAALDVPVTDLISEVSRCRRCEGAPPAGFTCNACGEVGAGMAGPQPRQRRLITRPFLEEVAKVYRDAMATQGAPTAAVARHFGAAHSTATKWVMAARSEGVLDPWWTANSGDVES